MVVQYNTLNQQPDILGSFRHQLLFGDVPGVVRDRLMLNNSRVTLPQQGVGHIHVKVLGHSIGFAGGLEFENIVSATFYENVRGETLRSVINWRNRVRDPATGASLLKPEYARGGQLKIFDTTGAVVHTFELLNVFPVTVEFYEIAEDATAAEIQVQFNVDSLRLIDEIAAPVGTSRTGTLSVSEFGQTYGGLL